MPKIKRTKEISIRVTEQELKQINSLKQANTTAKWIRDLALNVAPINKADPNLIRALGRIGSNLNQLTRIANTNKQIDQKLVNDINVIKQLMQKLIDDNLGD